MDQESLAEPCTPYNQQHQSRIRAPYPDIIVNLVTMWMLTAFTRENGGTAVVPGSHRRSVSPRPGSELDPQATYEGEVQLIGKAGDVGVFGARTWHAIAPNVSQEERVAVIIRYAPRPLSRKGAEHRLATEHTPLSEETRPCCPFRYVGRQ